MMTEKKCKYRHRCDNHKRNTLKCRDKTYCGFRENYMTREDVKKFQEKHLGYVYQPIKRKGGWI